MIFKIFTAPSPEKIAESQLLDARRSALEHEAAAEHHEALAMMYRCRIERLTDANDGIVTSK